MRRHRTTATILCANKVGDAVRLAVQTSTGKVIDRVVIVEVQRTRENRLGRRTNEMVREAAQDAALYPTACAHGVKILSSAYDGIDIHASETETTR